MHATLIAVLADFCRAAHENRADDTFLFEADPGRTKSKNWAQSLFYKLVEAAGLERCKMPGDRRHNICLHSFRHTFATDSFRRQELAGVDNYRAVPLLSIYLGHKKLLGTQKYLHTSDAVAEDILKTTSGIAKRIFPEAEQ